MLAVLLDPPMFRQLERAVAAEHGARLDVLALSANQAAAAASEVREGGGGKGLRPSSGWTLPSAPPAPAAAAAAQPLPLCICQR